MTRALDVGTNSKTRAAQRAARVFQMPAQYRSDSPVKFVVTERPVALRQWTSNDVGAEMNRTWLRSAGSSVT